MGGPRVARPAVRSGAGTRADKDRRAEIRAFAAAKGLTVADRGRISQEVIDMFEKAQRNREQAEVITTLAQRVNSAAKSGPPQKSAPAKAARSAGVRRGARTAKAPAFSS